MNHEDVEKLSNAAIAKSTLLKNNFFKYFVRAIMAGFFIVVAMIFSNVVGNVFSGAEEPAWGKFLGALVFSIAVLLISLVGGELFTGNNLVMAFGAYDKKVSWGEAGKVWLISYIGNFVGCLILSLIFVWAGASGTGDYFAGFIGNKLAIPAGQMFFRAVLCNFFVCLGVLCGIKLKSEADRYVYFRIRCQRIRALRGKYGHFCYRSVSCTGTFHWGNDQEHGDRHFRKYGRRCSFTCMASQKDECR